MKNSKGFTLIEILVSITLLSLILIGSMSANSLASNSVSVTKYRSKANHLAKEGLEALYAVRASDFTSISTGEFHPVMQSGAWTLVAGSEQVGDFTRKITLSPVLRNLVCDTPICEIASAGGIVDRLSFKVRIDVDWKEGDVDKNYSYDTLITYWR